ncbi:hypothetical protein BC830DRAFT_209033 [Chytriomyces sp. MP71]|nr:hypothetical protein BC830DRAFT_209033 [Chytriomyces sp. MP71]
MVKAFYVQPRKKVGAAQAIKALNLKLQSDSPLRVSHCIVTLDLLYRNCGLPFQETIYEDLQPCFQFYSQLVVPDKQSKMTPECRTQFLDMLAGWVSLDSVHQIPKLHGLCAELVTKGYPFSKAGLAKMPEVPPGNHDYFRLPNYEVQLKKVNDAKTPDGKSGFFNFFKK